MDVKSLLPVVIQLSLVLLVFAVGLQSRWADVTCVLRRPRLLLRGIFAVNFIVPAVAILMCLILPIAPMTKAGLVIMAVSPLAPFVAGKMRKAGDASYATGLYVALVLVAVILVPVTVALIGALFGRDVSLPVQAIAVFNLKSVLLPVGVGVLIATLWPRFGERAAPVLTIVAYLLLLPIVGLLLYTQGGKILGLVGDGTVAAIVVTVAAALAAGHILGGPKPEHRIALAQAAATRHPGIATLIAHRNFDDPWVMLAIILFLLTSVIVCTVYQVWANRRFRHPPAGEPLPAE